MPQRKKWVGFFVCMIIVLYLQAFLVYPIYANVEDIQTDGQNIHETKISDGKDDSDGGGGENVPWWKKAWNKIKDIGNKGLDIIEDIGDSIGDQWNEFLDWSSDAWDSTKDWISDVGGDIGDWFKEVGSAIGEFFSDAWDWIQKNEWVQTIVAGILATVVIVVGAFLIVGTWPALAVIAVIGGLALGAGFLYQWLAGEDYNFFGALGASLVGGLIGYFGMATGAFAAGWAWLRHTAGPAAWSWIKGTAVPWVVGRGQAAWSWMKTAAYPWIRGKAVSSWRWFKGLPAWGQIKAGFGIPNYWKVVLKGAGMSGLFSGLIDIANQLRGDDPFSVPSLLSSVFFGAITGGFFAPVLATTGLVLSGSLISVMSIASGLENYFSSGFGKGEWGSWQNFVTGTLTSFISIATLSKIFSKIPIPIVGEGLQKVVEEYFIKNPIDDLLPKSGDATTKTIDSPKDAPKKTEPVPSEGKLEKPADNAKSNSNENTTSPNNQLQSNPLNNRAGGGIKPQPLQ